MVKLPETTTVYRYTLHVDGDAPRVVQLGFAVRLVPGEVQPGSRTVPVRAVVEGLTPESQALVDGLIRAGRRRRRARRHALRHSLPAHRR